MFLGKQLPPSLFRKKSDITQKVGKSSEEDQETESDTVSYPRKKRRSKLRSGVENIAYYGADREMLGSDQTAGYHGSEFESDFSKLDSDDFSDSDFIL